MPVKTPGYFERLLAELKARELPIPRALAGQDPLPLALSTRADAPIWAKAHGYDEATLATLERAIAMTVRSGPYQKALAADLSTRHTLDGESVEVVSSQDRLAAALMLHAKALKDSALTRAPEPKEPVKAAAPLRRSTITLGALSVEEIARRRAALTEARR
jgi:hypothetical protein